MHWGPGQGRKQPEQEPFCPCAARRLPAGGPVVSRLHLSCRMDGLWKERWRERRWGWWRAGEEKDTSPRFCFCSAEPGPSRFLPCLRKRWEPGTGSRHRAFPRRSPALQQQERLGRCPQVASCKVGGGWGWSSHAASLAEHPGAKLLLPALVLGMHYRAERSSPWGSLQAIPPESFERRRRTAWVVTFALPPPPPFL